MLTILKKKSIFNKIQIICKSFVSNKSPKNENIIKNNFNFKKNKEVIAEDSNDESNNFNAKGFINREFIPPLNIDLENQNQSKNNKDFFSNKKKILSKSKIKYNKYDKNDQSGLSDDEHKQTEKKFEELFNNNNNSQKYKDSNFKKDNEESKEKINIGDYFQMDENKSDEHEDGKKDDKEELKSEKSEFLYGIHSVEAILKHKFRVPQELYILINYKTKPNDSITQLIKIAESQNIKIKYMTQGKLDKFTSNRHNEGIVIKCEKRKYSAVRKFKQFCEQNLKKEKGNLIILLDKVTDPQNFGSIIRSCVYIGAEKIIVNKLHSPPISPAVSKISLGASESVELFSLKFTKNFIFDARKEGWKIIATGCDLQTDSKNMTEDKISEKEESEIEDSNSNKAELPKSEKIELKELKLSYEDNIIVILGSESIGVSKSLLESSNYQVYIPPVLNKDLVGIFPYNVVDSLNVAVTTGIILNHIKFIQRRDVKKKEVNKNI